MADLTRLAQPSLHSSSLDLLRQRAEHCFNIYHAHAKMLFPLSAILLSSITRSSALHSSSSLWSTQSQGAISSSYYGLIRVLNEVANYLEQMEACDHMEPLEFPSVKDSPSPTNQFHEVALALCAPCFLYDNLHSSYTLQSSLSMSAEPFYKRILSHIYPSLSSPPPLQVQKSVITAHKKYCLELILSEIINATSQCKVPGQVLVILATVSASSLSAKSVVFLSTTHLSDHTSTLLIIPGPIARKEIVVPNLQVVKATGQLPPVNIQQYAETLSFTTVESTFGFFSRNKPVTWQVISPSHTGVLLPFMQKCDGLHSWGSIAKTIRAYNLPAIKNSLKSTSCMRNSKAWRVKLQKTKRSPSFSFKPMPSQKRFLPSYRSVSAKAVQAKKTLGANRGSLFCCHMSPGEYDSQLPFQTRIPLALTQHSTPHLRVKKQFTPQLVPSSSEARVYNFTVQLRLPDNSDSMLTMYIAKVSLHFSEARGVILAPNSLESLPIPCTCELPVGKFLTNKNAYTKYGLYSLHTQKIEWRPSGIKRYSGNTTACVSLSVQYHSPDASELIAYPAVDLSIDSSVTPDVVYITDVTS
ncbi:Hypothetical protein GLP15_2498 [Giardia lamblia P15]|uniref:Uncharacterized protein n=1 Tax=Giardia intestinalis (strain P15) TaxID=658858 RepID=E1EWG8_GIAIA|nr:Hypothetical protein GLP15_2498 [Giardia lamblia P15]